MGSSTGAQRVRKQSKANVLPARQRSQFSCMSCAMMMALRAHGINCNEDEVNKVLGARPMKGASWENALACGQHYGMRCTLTVPATVEQLRAWTDQGIPIIIAWNPENRPWSHASVVFDVDDQENVYIADPNIPDPRETVRIVPAGELYKKWLEQWPDYMVRRPAMAVEREITPDGRQVMASQSKVAFGSDSKAHAIKDYTTAVHHLEASADRVALATSTLRALGVDPCNEGYPFVEDIDTVAADIFRWRGDVDQKYASQAHRVARRFLEKK